MLPSYTETSVWYSSLKESHSSTVKPSLLSVLQTVAAEPLVPVVQPTYFGGKAKDSCIQVPLAQVHHVHEVNGPEELLGLEQHIQSAQTYLLFSIQ